MKATHWAIAAIAAAASIDAAAATLSAGFDHNAAVVSGQVWTWGGNTAGKLGNGSTTNSVIPVRAGTLTGITSVATGMATTFAVKSDGTLWAWGMNNQGQLGIASAFLCDVPNNGSRACERSPVSVTGVSAITAVGAGWGHGVALSSNGGGTVYTWGSTGGGTAVLGRTGTAGVPALIPSFSGVTAIAVGYFHTIALKTDGTVWAWGNGNWGELGNGLSTTSATPVQVSGLTNVVEISARGAFSLARKSDGSVWMWGNGRYGQRGDGAAPTSAVPSPIQVFAAGSGVVQLAAGYAHALVRKSDNTVWAWGFNPSGQIGATSPDVVPNGCGNSLDQPCARAPIQVATGAVSIAGGGAHSIVQLANGNLHAFGDNDSGQLGNQSGNYGPPITFSNNVYDPNSTTTPTGTFGSGGSTGTGSTSGDLNIGNLANGVYFPAGQVGVSTGSSPVTLTNLSSSTAIAISSITTTGDFSRNHNCGSSLAANATCQIDVVFTASGTGTRQGNLAIATDITDTPTINLTLTGNGVTVPGAPGTPSAVAGTGNATVSFAPPAGDGGSPVTSYTVTSSPGSIAASGAGSPITVNGLANGTAYTFTVRASNAYGAGPASAASNSVTPKANANVTASASPNPSVPGQSLVVSATVSGSSGTPTGSVVFWLDGAPGSGVPLPGCGARPVSAGVATCNWTTGIATAGSHTITAEYSGNTTYAAANSAPYAQTVNPGTLMLTVAKSGAGGGVVRSSPAGIDCGADCQEGYAGGTQVTLNASPNSSSSFAGWSGACSGAGACVVTVRDNISVTASFRRSGGAGTDFNFNGNPDLVWQQSASGSTYVWFMNGLVLQGDAFLGQIDPSWKVVGTGDFNGDGQTDVIWRNTSSGTAFVWYLVNGAFQSDAFLFTLDPVWLIAAVGDFNLDGKPDLLMRHASSGTAFAWFYDNVTPIGDQFLFGIDPAWKVENIGDFNNDGMPDLLFRNMSSGLAFAWNTDWNGSSLSLAGSSAPIFSIDPAWEVVQVADWNHDGMVDLVFRNTGSGVVFVWYLSGTALAGSDFIIQIDPSWEIVPRH